MAYVEVDEPIVLDSTGQDIKDELTAIKSAVQGLGTALGSDRALIDGSNIGDKATFRQNIGLTTGTTELSLTIPASQVFRQYIKKQYGVVYLYLDINNFKSTTEQTVGYLPEGYRPYHRILHDVIVINANDISFKGYAHFVIQTTGEITLQMQGNYTYPFCTLDISFPISNS